MIRRWNGMYESTPSYENSEELNRLAIPVWWQGHFTGWFGQCIEFVRRFLIQNRQLTFPSVRDANELYRRACEPHFFEPVSSTHLRNARVTRVIRPVIPRAGDLIFLQHPVTGHVGVVTGFNRFTDQIQVADQNYEYGNYWTDEAYAYAIPRTSREIRGLIRII